MKNRYLFHNKIDFEYETNRGNRMLNSNDHPKPRESKRSRAVDKNGLKVGIRNDVKQESNGFH